MINVSDNDVVTSQAQQ